MIKDPVTKKLPKQGREDDDLAVRALDDPVRMYFSRMSAIPLLIRDEETLYAKEIEGSRIKLN